MDQEGRPSPWGQALLTFGVALVVRREEVALRLAGLAKDLVRLDAEMDDWERVMEERRVWTMLREGRF